MRMLKCYQNPDSLKIEINTRIEILSGVRVNSEHLGKLLNGKNENDVLIQNATQDTSITLVANLENIKKPVGHQYFTIIVSPTDRDKMQQANVIYDNFAPCPHFCPKIYNYK